MLHFVFHLSAVLLLARNLSYRPVLANPSSADELSAAFVLVAVS